MSRQIVIAIDETIWQSASEAQRDAVMGMIGASGGGDTIAPVTWRDADGRPWMVSAYWREHVAGIANQQIAEMQAAARSIIGSNRLHATISDDASATLASIGLEPPDHQDNNT